MTSESSKIFVEDRMNEIANKLNSIPFELQLDGHFLTPSTTQPVNLVTPVEETGKTTKHEAKSQQKAISKPAPKIDTNLDLNFGESAPMKEASKASNTTATNPKKEEAKEDANNLDNWLDSLLG